MDIITLRDFIDLGGTFILALVLLLSVVKRLSNMEELLVKCLTLLTVLTKTQTNFNGVEKVLGKTLDSVGQSLVDAESSESK